ncbi:MAG: hypothetical protein Q9163_001135 [Psora crenata]
MAFFFRNKQAKSDLVRRTKDLLAKLLQPPQLNKTQDELSKSLAEMKLTLQGTHEVDSSPEAVHQLVKDMIQEDFFYSLVRSIHRLRFEARKDSQTILSYALRFRPPGSTEEDAIGLAYIIDHRPEVVVQLCRGYEHRESAMPCGAVLREILRNDHITAIVLHDESQRGEDAVRVVDIDFEQPQTGSGIFWKFFDYIDKSAFEASTDAFTTFREILTKHKTLISQYLDINFDLFFERYNKVLIGSESYVTKRQSIKLLGEILLDRANYSVMTAYVDKGEHLKLCMVLLKDDRKMVQYEGFHVFKVNGQVFVANPHKSDAVKKILTQNRDRLLKFLPGFLEDRQDDDQFLDEKSFLIRQIQLLPAPPATS